LFYKFFPLFANFRGVGKLNIFITLCLAALAAMGFDEVLRRPGGLAGLSKGLTAGSAFFLLAALVFFLVPRLGGAGLFRQFLAYAPSMTENLALCALCLGLLAALAVLGLRHPAWRLGFLASAFLELFLFVKGNSPSFDLQALNAKLSPLREVYREDPGDYRVLADSTNYALGTGGLDVWGEDPVIPSRYADFVRLTQHCDARDFFWKFYFKDLSPVLGLLRLRYFFKDQGGSLALQRMGWKEAPRAFFVDRWKVLGKEEALQEASGPGFDPTREVLLESPPGLDEVDGKLADRLELKDLSSDRIEIQSQLSKPAVLVITDNYSRGWKVEPVSTDAQASYQVMPANGFQRAIPLAAGSHHFYLEYRPAAFVVGKWISFFSWSAFILLLLWNGIDHRKNRGTQRPGLKSA
jgi:hypothetical protein